MQTVRVTANKALEGLYQDTFSCLSDSTNGANCNRSAKITPPTSVAALTISKLLDQLLLGPVARRQHQMPPVSQNLSDMLFILLPTLPRVLRTQADRVVGALVVGQPERPGELPLVFLSRLDDVVHPELDARLVLEDPASQVDGPLRVVDAGEPLEAGLGELGERHAVAAAQVDQPVRVPGEVQPGGYVSGGQKSDALGNTRGESCEVLMFFLGLADNFEK